MKFLNLFCTFFFIIPLFSYASEIQLTLINRHSDAGIWVDKDIIPGCEAHPIESEWCIIPPESTKTVKFSQEPEHISFRYFRLVSMGEAKQDASKAEGKRPSLLSSAETTINTHSGVNSTAITCNTLGHATGYNVKVTVHASEPVEALCQADERKIRTTSSANNNITVEFAPSLLQ